MNQSEWNKVNTPAPNHDIEMGHAAGGGGALPDPDHPAIAPLTPQGGSQAGSPGGSQHGGSPPPSPPPSRPASPDSAHMPGHFSTS